MAEDHLGDLDEDPLPEMPRAEEVKGQEEAHVAKPAPISPDSFESASVREFSDDGETEQDTAVAAPAQSSQDTAVAASSPRAKVHKDRVEAKRVDAAVRAQIMSKTSKEKEEEGVALRMPNN